MGKLRNIFGILLICLPLMCGCENTPNKVKDEPVSEVSKEMERVLKDVDKEDTLTLFWLLSGVSEYTSRYSNIETTYKINSLYKTVKARFGKEENWLSLPGENDDPSDIIDRLMKENEFDKPGKFTDESKQKFVKLFKELSDGALKAYKGKK